MLNLRVINAVLIELYTNLLQLVPIHHTEKVKHRFLNVSARVKHLHCNLSKTALTALRFSMTAAPGKRYNLSKAQLGTFNSPASNAYMGLVQE